MYQVSPLSLPFELTLFLLFGKIFIRHHLRWKSWLTKNLQILKHTKMHRHTHPTTHIKASDPFNVCHPSLLLFYCMIFVYTPQPHHGLCKGQKHFQRFPFPFHWDMFRISSYVCSYINLIRLDMYEGKLFFNYFNRIFLLYRKL
jgi:hypothetical protein